MKSIIIALLASTALAAPAFAAPNATATQPAQPQSQSQMKPQNAPQPSAQPQKQSQAQPNKAPQQSQTQTSVQKTIAPNSLSESQIRQVQTALNKDGFKVGRADGIWGPQTRAALENFQKNKGMTNNGQLTQNTMAALGVNLSAPQRNHG